VGWLCAQGSFQGKTVQVLVSGITYDHNYWDWPQNPALYSYVDAATAGGYATFNFDRIGIGASDKPPAADVTVTSEAYVAHELIQGLRQGNIGGVSFPKVIEVGHSLGTGIVWEEAATYADVDGAIVTGGLHTANTNSTFFTTLYPAQQDPKFAQANLPAGYLATEPGTRGASFYNTSFAGPQVVAKDEALKQTGTTGELSDFASALSPTVTQQIHVPVFDVIGQKDSSFCDETVPGLSCASSAAVLAREAPDYSPQARLQAYVLPLSGHDINLHPDAQLWYLAALNWSNRFVGTR
jgi:pimeloyl-ACP methyl ester carboxylesterase